MKKEKRAARFIDVSEGCARSWISGFRGAGIYDYLFQTAINFGLDIEIQENKGLISSTYHYVVRGDSSRIDKFLRTVAMDCS